MSIDPDFRRQRRRLSLASCALLLEGASVMPVLAQATQPSRPVTILCAYPAGALGDSTARIVARGLAERWGVPVVVENKTGAAGMIAASEVARARGDGTLLLCMIPEALSVAKALDAPMSFDPLQVLAPVAEPAVSACVLATNAAGRFKDYGELKAFAKANPGRLNFGIQGTGSAFHLAVERWARIEGIEVNAVPYRGGAPIMTDLLAGRLDAMFVATSLGMPGFQGGRLRPLAVTTALRISQLPEVQTLRELGVQEFDLTVTIGLLASASTPAAMLLQMNQDVRQVMRTASARRWMQDNAVESGELEPAALSHRMQIQVQDFGDIAKRANIKLSS